MQLNFKINSFLLLCLVNIAKASMYSNSDSAYMNTFCGSSLENRSCIIDPHTKTKSCHIPSIYKPLFNTDILSFDETDSSNIDGDCCCPTKLHSLIKQTHLVNINNEKKKLAFGDCNNVVPMIPIGICDKKSDSCGQCREIKRRHTILIEENGEYKFDTFELSSHCSCSG